MSLGQEIYLNNRAVAYLQEGQVREAAELFRYALKSMKERFLHQSRSMTSSDLQPTPEGSKLGTRRREQSNRPRLVSDSSFDDLLIVSDDEEDEDCSRMTLDTDDELTTSLKAVPVLSEAMLLQLSSQSYLVMYDRALMVSKHEQDREVVTASILYNMALVNHARGVRFGRSSLLTKAIQLYKMSLDVLRPDHERPVDLLYLACFNNAAQIYSQLFHRDEMRQCLECMREILGKGDNICYNEDFVFFYLNAMLYIGEELSLAPAA